MLCMVALPVDICDLLSFLFFLSFTNLTNLVSKWFTEHQVKFIHPQSSIQYKWILYYTPSTLFHRPSASNHPPLHSLTLVGRTHFLQSGQDRHGKNPISQFEMKHEQNQAKQMHLKLRLPSISSNSFVFELSSSSLFPSSVVWGWKNASFSQEFEMKMNKAQKLSPHPQQDLISSLRFSVRVSYCITTSKWEWWVDLFLKWIRVGWDEWRKDDSWSD